MTHDAHIHTPPLDLVGVGFGPANLSLCALFASLRWKAGWTTKRIGFLERRPDFAWHPDMLLDGARMQVAFVKDLVTPRDPTSPYSFLNYLFEQGRMEDFLNLHTFHPTRREYHDYFSWAAAKLSDYVTYEQAVADVSPIVDADGSVRRLSVSFGGEGAGCSRSRVTSNLVLALGGKPALPRGAEHVKLTDAAFHSNSFLANIRRYSERGRDRPYEFLTVGAGQSAAEIFQYLAREFPQAGVTMAFSTFALMPANSSVHANEIFNPESVDLFYELPDTGKRLVLENLRHTNYAAVDEDVIQDIAELLYDQRLCNHERLRLLRFTRLLDCQQVGDKVTASLQDTNTGAVHTRQYDGVVYATGYDFRHVEGLLTNLEPYLRRTADGALVVERDYAIETDNVLQARVFLQGATEESHGLSSTLLSVLSHRSYEILQSAMGAKSAHKRPSEQTIYAARGA